MGGEPYDVRGGHSPATWESGTCTSSYETSSTAWFYWRWQPLAAGPPTSVTLNLLGVAAEVAWPARSGWPTPGNPGEANSAGEGGRDGAAGGSNGGEGGDATSGGDFGIGGRGGAAGFAAVGGAAGSTAVGGAAGVTAAGGAAGSGGSTSPDLGVQKKSDKLDVLLVVDNSTSMADKQNILSASLPSFVMRLLNPLCVDGQGRATPQQPASGGGTCTSGAREFAPVKDLHFGVISASLGSHGGPVCGTATSTSDRLDDQAELIPTHRDNVASHQNAGYLSFDATGQAGVSDSMPPAPVPV